MSRAVALLAAIAVLSCDSHATGLTGVTPTQLPAARLVILSQPSSEAVNTNITPAIQVAVQTANGVTVTQSAASISVIITPGTGAAGAVLSGTNPNNAANGVAVFNNLRVDRIGTAYTLTFSSNGLTSAVSSPFDIVP